MKTQRRIKRSRSKKIRRSRRTKRGGRKKRNSRKRRVSKKIGGIGSTKCADHNKLNDVEEKEEACKAHKIGPVKQCKWVTRPGWPKVCEPRFKVTYVGEKAMEVLGDRDFKETAARIGAQLL
jgi:hypothetical protein